MNGCNMSFNTRDALQRHVERHLEPGLPPSATSSASSSPSSQSKMAGKGAKGKVFIHCTCMYMYIPYSGFRGGKIFVDCENFAGM